MTRTVLTGGRVFDGTGSDPSFADVAVEDGRIVGLGTGLDGDTEIDVRDRTILPGLFDCHVHVCVSNVDLWGSVQQPFSRQFYEAARNLEKTLAVGITSVRDAGGADLGIKEAVADGTIAGPRLQISISMLSQTGGHGDDWYPSGAEVPFMISHPGRPSGLVDGPDEVRRKVRELVRMGAAGVKNAVRAGVRSIEHGIYLDDEAIELMLANQTWLVPTLAAPRAVLIAAAGGAQLPDTVVEKAREVAEVHTASVKAAVAAEVPIAMGTDSGVGPHGSNLDELPLLTGCGMTPSQALVSATSEAARLCGLQDVTGRVAPGLAADLVVMEGSALDLDTMRSRVRQVWRDGELMVDAS